MEIQYVIINFIILLTILVIAGRKIVKRIFGGRLEKINKELDEAEEIEKLEMPLLRTQDPYMQFKFSGMGEAHAAIRNLPPDIEE